MIGATELTIFFIIFLLPYIVFASLVRTLWVKREEVL